MKRTGIGVAGIMNRLIKQSFPSRQFHSRLSISKPFLSDKEVKYLSKKKNGLMASLGNKCLICKKEFNSQAELDNHFFVFH